MNDNDEFIVKTTLTEEHKALLSAAMKLIEAIPMWEVCGGDPDYCLTQAHMFLRMTINGKVWI